jgi:hypothetical protein
MLHPNKSAAAWLAVVAGALGAHRFYLHGWRDTWAWLHLPVAAAGALGVWRLRVIGQDDVWVWWLLPGLGLLIAQAMLSAIVLGLTPDERWQARHHPNHTVAPTRWGPVLAAVAALLVGGTVLMGSLAYAIQKFFEWQLTP